MLTNHIFALCFAGFQFFVVILLLGLLSIIIGAMQDLVEGLTLHQVAVNKSAKCGKATKKRRSVMYGKVDSFGGMGGKWKRKAWWVVGIALPAADDVEASEIKREQLEESAVLTHWTSLGKERKNKSKLSQLASKEMHRLKALTTKVYLEKGDC